MKYPGPDGFAGEFYTQNIINSIQTLPEITKGWRSFQLILWGNYCPDTKPKTVQKEEERKLQMIIFNEYRQ